MKAKWLAAIIIEALVVAGLGVLVVQMYLREQVAGAEAARLARLLADLEKTKDTLTDQVKGLTASNATLTQQLTEIRSSDRRAYTEAARLETDGNLAGALAAYESFVRAYPDSALRSDAEGAVLRLRKDTAARQAAEETALKNAVAEAAKAPDALAAIKVLDALVRDHPSLAEQVKGPRARYAELAERLAEERRSEAAVGIAIDQVETGWVRTNIGFEALWVPEVRFEVRNVSEQPLKFLQFVVQFVKTGTKVTFGPDATVHPVDSVGNPPLQPGYSKLVTLRGGTGFQSDQPFSTESPPKMTAELFVGREFKERLLLRSIEIEPKPHYAAATELRW